jgi:hypothetical protein
MERVEPEGLNVREGERRYLHERDPTARWVDGQKEAIAS